MLTSKLNSQAILNVKIMDFCSMIDSKIYKTRVPVKYFF